MNTGLSSNTMAKITNFVRSNIGKKNLAYLWEQASEKSLNSLYHIKDDYSDNG